MDSFLLKGTDRTTAAIGGDTGVSDRDEIVQYLHGRYISPSEAAWQLFVAVHLAASIFSRGSYGHSGP